MNAQAVTSIMTEARRLGLVLQADQGSLKYRPRSCMTPELARRIKDNKAYLLEHLGERATPLRIESESAADNTPDATSKISPAEQTTEVMSVLSLSELGTSDSALWSEDELALLGRSKTNLADLPLVAQVKTVFADMGLVLVSIEKTHGRGGQARRRAAQLIRQARQADAPADPNLPIAMRDAWEERMAICTIDGGLTEHQAEDIALQQLKDFNSPLRK